MKIEDGTIFATGEECEQLNKLPFLIRLIIGLRLIFGRAGK